MKIKNITNSFQNTKPIFPSRMAFSTHSPLPYCSTVHALTATTLTQVWIWSPQYFSIVHAPTTTDLEDGFEPFQLGNMICRFGFGGQI